MHNVESIRITHIKTYTEVKTNELVLPCMQHVVIHRISHSLLPIPSSHHKEVDGTKYWPHFGEELLDLNAVQLREFERAKSPCLAIIDKWMAL